MPKWFDLGKQGVQLRYAADGNTKNFVLVLLGVEKESAEWNGLITGPLQFRPSPTGKPVLFRPFAATNRIEIKHLREVFPNARTIEVANSDEFRLAINGSGAKVSPQEMAVAAAMKIATPIGRNAVNQRVFETSSGSRFVIDEEGRNVEEARLPAALCLRGKKDDSGLPIPGNLAVCAQGFVASLMRGAHAETSDVLRFVDVLYGPGASTDAVLPAHVLRTIEAEMAARVLERHQIAGDGAYREAQSLYENSPPHMGDPKGSGAVPLPAAVAVQELARAFGGTDQMAIYVPHLYDGALVAMLGQTYMTLTDQVDPDSREGQLRKLVPEVVNVIERAPNEAVAPHRLSILNVEDCSDATLTQLRADLKKRHPNGMTVLLVPEYLGDSAEQKAASKEKLARFARDLQADYAVPGLSMMAPVMRKKMGLDSGLLMMVVGHRYSQREKEIRGEEWMARQVSGLYDWDALRALTNDVLVRVHEAAGRKLTAAEEAALRANEGSENSYQLPYQSFSKNGEVELMIPRNLAGPTYKALQQLQDRVGDLDTYLQNVVGMSDDQYRYLAPEQVDAGALMVASLDRGRAFCLGDQTGAGKGATLALATAWAWQRGYPVIFITKQDNLFSDFYRDLKKTGLHENMRPLVLNHDATVVDQFSENLDRVGVGISRKEFLANYRFGLSGFDNPNLIFATYSQFSGGMDSEKSDWIRAIAENAVIIFDESHIAAGDASRLGQVCTEVADKARAVAYSSATWLKDARQMRFYQRVLPDSVDAKMVADAMQAGGESIQEVFTSMLAEDGLFIRRERDASQLEFESIRDDDNLSKNEELANQVSIILTGLQRLCGVTDQVGRRLTRAQVDKLDAAKLYINTALKRAQEAAAEMVRGARGELVNDEGAEEGGDARGIIGGDLGNAAQREIDEQATMTAIAETENESFLAAGQGQIIHDAQGMTEMDVESQLDSLRSLQNLTLADLGLDKETVNTINTNLANLLAGNDESDARARLKREVKRIEKMIKGIRTKTTAFGSILFLTQRTLNVSLQARFAAERAVAAIQAGEKPIIFLEQTFETPLIERLQSESAVKNEDGTISVKPVTLKDNLREMYASIVNISHTNADGERYEGTIMDSRFMVTEQERVAIQEGLNTLDDLIDALPDDLYCSPIDTICHAIRKAGYTVGEATGRKFHVVDMEGDVWRVAPRDKKKSKISYIERAFNFGEYDAIVGNKAMSTGLSVHASRDFSDQRRRRMMFTQVFSDINDYIQAIGRGDRRGQVISPVVEMLQSGLSSEARVMMSHFKKLRKLLASTTSNRSSRYEQQELPDLFNSVGDASVRDFLQANPGVAVRLGVNFAAFMPGFIKNNGNEVEVQTHGLAKFVVSRLDLLPVAESRAVYQEIAYNFEEVLNELDAQGVNPLRANLLDMTDAESAMVTAREDLLPPLLNEDGEAESVFDEAVELHTVTANYRFSARTWEETLAEIEKNTRSMFLASVAKRPQALADRPPADFVPDWTVPTVYQSTPDGLGPLMRAIKLMPAGLRVRVEKMFDAMDRMMRSSDVARQQAGAAELTEALTVETVDQRHARAGAGQEQQPISPAQVLQRRKEWLLRNLQYLMPGQYVSISPPSLGWGDRKVYKGVVVEINVPPAGRETNLTRWSVVVQQPGYSRPRRFTLHELYKATFIGMNQWLPGERIMADGLFQNPVPEAFNDFDEGKHRSMRYVLRGNLFRAASIAASNRMGAGGVLQFKNEPPARVIALRKDLDKSQIYSAVPVELTKDEVPTLFVTTWEGLNNPPRKNANFWEEFLRSSLDVRGIHSDKEVKTSGVSIYWLSTSLRFSAALDDEFSEEERAELRAQQDQQEGQSRNLLAGIGLRIRAGLVDPIRTQRFVAQVNGELGYEAVEFKRGRLGAGSQRYVVRFKNKDGERDSPDEIRHKLSVVSRAAAQSFNVNRFYTHSKEMRLLALAVSAKSREQARALRCAADEERQMRMQMSNFHMSAVDEDEEAEQPEPEDERPPTISE